MNKQDKKYLGACPRNRLSILGQALRDCVQILCTEHCQL